MNHADRPDRVSDEGPDPSAGVVTSTATTITATTTTAAGITPLADRLLVPPYGVDRRGMLTVDEWRVADLVETYGSPMFIYSANRMRCALTSLRAATHGRADLYFSIKANPHPAIIQVFLREGAGAEIASGAEYETARRAGVGPQRILFAGPGKSSAELRHVIDRGIGEIHVEAEDEIARISRIAAELETRVNICLRINPVDSAQGGSMRMGGKPIQFGIDEERIDAVIDAWRHDPWLQIAGIHLFAGTQILDAQVLVTQWSHALELGRRIGRYLGQPLASIDLGGGLGIPYVAHEQAIDIELLTRLSEPLFNAVAGDPWLSGTRIVLEPGRFLVGEAGIYVTEVISVKESRGQWFIVTNGGMHHHLAATGNLGQVIKRDYPIVVATRMPLIGSDPPLEPHPMTIVGPLCTPLDTWGRKTALPMPVVGDLIAILQSGAYGLSASPNGFLSQPIAAEVLIDRQGPRLIRAGGTFESPITPPIGF